MKFRGILFDLDGTLLDTSELIISSFKYTLKLHFERKILASEVYPYFSRPLEDSMEYFDSNNVDTLLTTYREYSILHHDNMIRTFKGVLEALQVLHNNGIIMAIVTSMFKTIALTGLSLFNMETFFPVIIGHEHCQKHKPDLEPINIALAEILV